MLSKEEIQEIKETLQEYDHYYSDHATDENGDIIDEEDERLANIFNSAWYYIEQLETDKQKLIEKLEKDSSDSYEVQHKDSHEIILTQKVEPVRQYIKQELLPVLKGEKNE